MKKTLIEEAQNRVYKFLFKTHKSKAVDEIEAETKTLITDLSNLILDQSRLLSECDVAAIYPFRREYLRDKRCKGEGPAYFKFGRSRNSRVYYRVADLESWIAKNRFSDPMVAKLQSQM